MKIYAAPMEGITGYIYRNVHHRHFEGVDRYYAPFVVANYTRKFKHKEREDIAPENNAEISMVPQVLGNKAEEVLWAASEFAGRGYREFNLNLGCPVPTIAKKKKGSGFLGYPDELDRFLGEVYEGLDRISVSAADAAIGVGERVPIRMSVKTRLGVNDFDDAVRLIEIYNKYPICELTIHPRTQKDLYKNAPDLDVFERVLEKCELPVCYNGNINSCKDFTAIHERFPQIDCFMLGRGLIADPSLPEVLRDAEPVTAARLRAFHDDLYQSYQGTLPGGAVIINRMKEVWHYMGNRFVNADRCLKEIRKASNPVEYEAAVRVLFSCCEVKESVS